MSTQAHQVGLIFGKFYPLHSGHIYLIEKAASQVDELHIMLGCEIDRDRQLFEASNLVKAPLVKDRFHWLQKTFKNRPNIHIHILDEAGIVSYPNGWQDWSTRVKQLLAEHQVVPTVIFTSELQDAKKHEYYYGCPVNVIDANRDFMTISATQIRSNPYQYWDFIARAAKPFFVKKIAFIGKSEKFKQLPKQLANIFNTTFVSNGYINYIQREQIHSDHQLLDESDYVRIAMVHADRMDQAAIVANRVLFTALDFQTLHRFYKKAFNQDSMILQELEDNYYFDLVINEDDFASRKATLSIFESVIHLVQKQISF